MSVTFQKLVSVYFQHDYFADKKFTSFTVTPSEATLHNFKRFGLLFRPAADGFTILFQNPLGSTLRTVEEVQKEELSFRFKVELNDPFLYNYTALAQQENITDTIFVFDNTFTKHAAVPQELLHQQAFVSGKDAVLLNTLLWPKGPAYASLYFTKPFAHLHLQLNDQSRPEYYIRFSAKATYWKYILSTDEMQQWNDLLIVDKNAAVEFSGPDDTELPGGRKVKSFTSKQPIELMQYAQHSFQLGDKYDPVSRRFETELVGVLPSPDIRAISKIDVATENDERGNNVIKNNYSFIVI